MKSWKTTITGFGLLGFAAYFWINGHVAEGGACFVIGLGFFSAKDATVTGVGDDAKTKKELEKEE